MAKSTSMSIGEHFARFINTQVQAGRYGSSSDVVRAGLRLLEEHETKVKTLQKALIEGERSGVAENFDPETFLQDIKANRGLHG